MIRKALSVLAVSWLAASGIAAPPVVGVAVAAAPASAPALGRDGSGSEPAATPAEPADPRRAEIRAATAALTVWGYAPGPVDGDWDAADAAALREYQADWQLPETGALTPELIARLTREHPETAPRWVETPAGCRVWNRYPQARENVSWTGDCVNGLTSGTGVLTWAWVIRGGARTETYTGARREGREHGHGVYVGADGSRYAGGWRAGLKHGQGIHRAPEGHVYVGGYRDGLRHGRGTYIRGEGSRYEGEWRAGVQHGRGIAAWPDGSRYEGRLADGKPEGQGTLTFPDGNVYSGTWRAGCFAEAFRGATAGTTPAACGFE